MNFPGYDSTGLNGSKQFKIRQKFLELLSLNIFKIIVEKQYSLSVATVESLRSVKIAKTQSLILSLSVDNCVDNC